MTVDKQSDASPAGNYFGPSFGEKVVRVQQEYGPLCVGLDPHPEVLAQWGLADTPRNVAEFAKVVLESAKGLVGFVKPQVALFERHGSAGMAVLEEFLQSAREAGIVTIADAKRGDIGSTMVAYSEAFLGINSPFESDAVTLSPFLGFESLRPAIEQAKDNGKGVFILALTSNPEGAAIQHSTMSNGKTIALDIFERATRENREQLLSEQKSNRDQWEAGHRIGSIGVVVGATVGSDPHRLGLEFAGLNGPILVPGFGAQGAGIQELQQVFGEGAKNLIVNSGRAILKKGPQHQEIREAIKSAADALKIITSW